MTAAEVMDTKDRMDGCICANGAKVAEIVHPYCHAHVPPEMEAELASLRAEVERCHARLEIDHHFTLNDAGETVRVDVPMAERDKDLDAVLCRDTTIELVEDENKHLAAEVERLKAEHAQVAGALGCVHEQSMGECHAGTVDDVLCAIAALKARPVGVREEVRREIENADALLHEDGGMPASRAWLASLPGGEVSRG